MTQTFDYRNNLVLSTCGVSLLGNLCPADQKNNYYAAANLKEDAINEKTRELLDKIHDEIFEKINQQETPESLASSSAELQSLTALLKRFNNGQSLSENNVFSRHILLVNKTYVAEKCANLIKFWLEKQDLECKILSFDIPVDDLKAFYLCLDDIVNALENEINENVRSCFKVYFNLTGGYKSLQGYLQVIGMQYADELVYLFERSSKLLRIPKLPLNINFESIPPEFIRLFRRIDNGLKVEYSELESAPEYMIIDLDGEALFSYYGQLCWNRQKESCLSQKLMQPISDQVKFCGNFENQINNLKDSDRIFQINDKLDRFCSALELNDLNRLTVRDSFKKLKNQSKNNLTHELYAWSDGSAKRIFGKFNGQAFEIYALNDHLR